MRCRASHQGDRCRKGLGHDSRILLTPDPWHEGQFSRWDGLRVEPLRLPPRIHRKDLRTIDRVLRAVDPKSLDPREQAAAKYSLQAIIDWVRGGRK